MILLKKYNDALLKSSFNPIDELICPTTFSNKKCRIKNIIYSYPLTVTQSKQKLKKSSNSLTRISLKGSKLHKIFNKNISKITYSCSTSLKLIMKAHNKKVLSVPSPTDKPCNCTNATQCLFNGQCLQKGIYKATNLHQNITKNTVALLMYLLRPDITSTDPA